ncbi:MAG: hydrogenase expression/formation protein HypE [Gammaproteobacteria bacterium]|nr:hydrogenase expression/formation protein HypE [Gammaproteobacteria bacterium]MCP5135237.1 hydrogenase expression/formation protein HypE [Gammaproteobacteria bacterium]
MAIRFNDPIITLAHGAGGKAMRDLVEGLILPYFDNELLAPLEDQARVPLGELTALGDRLAMTTDSFVVDPLEFPGGDIGTLAINGTVNDLAMSGAIPRYLTCGLIIEEGLEVGLLKRILGSMKQAAAKAGVAIVSGDTKVVQRGGADKLFINTAGIGVIPADADIRASRAQVGDVVIVNGVLGDHGAAVLNARGDLALDVELRSDCQPLNRQVQALRAACPDVHCLRDATRGGVATVLNEFAESAQVAIRLNERDIPVRDTVRGVCEILGLDALYLANEGRLVAILPAEYVQATLSALHACGDEAHVIGEVIPSPAGRVLMKTVFGSERIVDRLVGEQLPRIC